MDSLQQIAQWPVDHASAAVIGADGAIVETFGDQDRVYPLASVTKLLVGYAVLIAVEEGAIELELPAGPEGSTVRHLLAHASGLAFDENRVRAEPGTKRIYSSAGFEVLADTVARESGIDFPDYFAEAVCAPLAMTSTSLPGPAGHGGCSSAADLAAFVRELCAPQLVSTQLFEQATAVCFPGLSGILPGYGMHKPNDWGLAFEIRSTKSPHWTGAENSPRTFGHFGQSGTFLWVDPQAGLAAVVLTDRPFGEWAITRWPQLSDRVLSQFQ